MCYKQGFLDPNYFHCNSWNTSKNVTVHIFLQQSDTENSLIGYCIPEIRCKLNKYLQSSKCMKHTLNELLTIRRFCSSLQSPCSPRPSQLQPMEPGNNASWDSRVCTQAWLSPHSPLLSQNSYCFQVFFVNNGLDCKTHLKRADVTGGITRPMCVEPWQMVFGFPHDGERKTQRLCQVSAAL